MPARRPPHPCRSCAWACAAPCALPLAIHGCACMLSFIMLLGFWALRCRPLLLSPSMLDLSSYAWPCPRLLLLSPLALIGSQPSSSRALDFHPLSFLPPSLPLVSPLSSLGPTDTGGLERTPSYAAVENGGMDTRWHWAAAWARLGASGKVEGCRMPGIDGGRIL